jgi:hypothetical protein
MQERHETVIIRGGQQRGVTSLQTCLFPWPALDEYFQVGVFFGVRDDAAYLADHMRVVGLA